MKCILLAVLVALLLPGTAIASDDRERQEVFEALRANLPLSERLTNADQLQASPVPGLWRLDMGSAGTALVSSDGNYLLFGDVYHIEGGGQEKISEIWEEERRVVALNEMKGATPGIRVGASQASQVHVFLSHRCGFCRRFWSNLDSYLDQNIAFIVHPFVLSGPNSSEMEETVKIWCDLSQTRRLLDSAYAGDPPVLSDTDSCSERGIIASQRLGTALGAQATPVFVTESGKLISGLVAPDALRDALDRDN